MQHMPRQPSISNVQPYASPQAQTIRRQPSLTNAQPYGSPQAQTLQRVPSQSHIQPYPSPQQSVQRLPSQSHVQTQASPQFQVRPPPQSPVQSHQQSQYQPYQQANEFIEQEIKVEPQLTLPPPPPPPQQQIRPVPAPTPQPKPKPKPQAPAPPKPQVPVQEQVPEKPKTLSQPQPQSQAQAPPQSQYVPPTPAQSTPPPQVMFIQPHQLELKPTFSSTPKTTFSTAPKPTFTSAPTPPPPKPAQLPKVVIETKVKKEEPVGPLDFQVVLLSLAEEYLDAACKQGTLLARTGQEEDCDDYFQLVAAGLGCLEAALKQTKKLPPETEAAARLRYAQVLYEETENEQEAEEALDKGITLCKQNRLLDLQYTMQLLLARILFKSKPKAALKRLDSMIADIETYKHTRWEYAFRFLRVTLSWSSGYQDLNGAIQNLQKIAALSKRSGDRPIYSLSNIFQALVHLQSSTANAVEEAQRALAAARSQQLSGMGDLPQLNALIIIVDLACSLQENEVAQAAEKMSVMHAVMDSAIEDPRWRPDGSFFVSFAKSGNGNANGTIETTTGDGDGMDALRLAWLPKVEVYAMCYLLSAMTSGYKNSSDGGKAEKFVDEGARMIRSELSTRGFSLVC